jgi:hypothetical protein
MRKTYNNMKILDVDANRRHFTCYELHWQGKYQMVSKNGDKKEENTCLLDIE